MYKYICVKFMEMVKKVIKKNRTYKIRDKLHSVLKVKAAQLGLDMSEMVEAGILIVTGMNRKEIELRLEDA